MRVRAVPRDRLAESTLEDWVDRRRRPYIDEMGIAWIPVRNGLPFDREIPERRHSPSRGWFMLGDVAVLHGERPLPSEVEEIVGFRHPRGVLWIEALEDITRTPRTELLWGWAGEVIHRESGYVYHLDPQKVMFSQGNRNEKQRLAALVRGSGRAERVADTCAGIGYFTIPLAGSGAMVHAIEINPVAFGYLEINIAANGFSDRVRGTLGDCRECLEGVYDRVVMGHFGAIEMLPAVLRHVQTGSILHVHSLGEERRAIADLAERAGFSSTIEVHKVKKYRPHVWHVVQDVMLE